MQFYEEMSFTECLGECATYQETLTVTLAFFFFPTFI